MFSHAGHGHGQRMSRVLCVIDTKKQTGRGESKTFDCVLDNKSFDQYPSGKYKLV